MHCCPKKLKARLAAFAFLTPYFFHNLVRNIAGRFRPFRGRLMLPQRRSQYATSNQSLLLVGEILSHDRNDPRDRLISITNQNLFAVTYHLNVGAEPRLEVADLYTTHTTIVLE